MNYVITGKVCFHTEKNHVTSFFSIFIRLVSYKVRGFSSVFICFGRMKVRESLKKFNESYGFFSCQK